MADYSLIDNSPLPHYLFYPRRDYAEPPPGAFDLAIQVAEGVAITCRGYPVPQGGPWILFFHGNGEVVSDYDGIAPFYNRCGMNLLVADYRGYGASGGSPSFTAMIADAGAVFRAALAELRGRGAQPGLPWVMGRSLGSISALELAYQHPGSLRGVIIESGFISVARLIDHLGLPSPGDLSGLDREYTERAGAVTVPALVLHGEADTLVPLRQGRQLYESLGSARKELVTIPRAGHNDIMFTGLEQYMEAIRKFVAATGDAKQEGE